MKLILSVKLRGFPERLSSLDEQALRVLLLRADVREGLAEAAREGLVALLPPELAQDLEVVVLGTNPDRWR